MLTTDEAAEAGGGVEEDNEEGEKNEEDEERRVADGDAEEGEGDVENERAGRCDVETAAAAVREEDEVADRDCMVGENSGQLAKSRKPKSTTSSSQYTFADALTTRAMRPVWAELSVRP